jgi:hypothetical protein
MWMSTKSVVNDKISMGCLGKLNGILEGLHAGTVAA